MKLVLKENNTKKSLNKKINEGLSFDELRDLEKLIYPYLKNIWVHEVHFENMKNLEGDDVNLLLYADVDGDWKHDHLAYKDAVKEFCDDNGFEIVSHRQREIGHSESDSYEAEHIFWIHKKKLKEKLYKRYRVNEEMYYGKDFPNGFNKRWFYHNITDDKRVTVVITDSEHADVYVGKKFWQNDYPKFELELNDDGTVSIYERPNSHRVFSFNFGGDSFIKNTGDFFSLSIRAIEYALNRWYKNLLHESVNYYNGKTRLSVEQREDLNRICSKYCGWKEPQEIRPLWKELSDYGIDDIVI